MKRQIAVLLFIAAASVQAQTTVILVRHADRANLGSDSPLSQAGFARAKELARVLASAHIDAIYATQFLRTQQTATPLAEEHHLKPVIVPATGTYARDLTADIVAHHAGQTVVVVSHSDKIPEVLRAFGVPDPPSIGLTEYDDLFVVTPPKLLTLRYGAIAR